MEEKGKDPGFCLEPTDRLYDFMQPHLPRMTVDDVTDDDSNTKLPGCQSSMPLGGSLLVTRAVKLQDGQSQASRAQSSKHTVAELLPAMT